MKILFLVLAVISALAILFCWKLFSDKKSQTILLGVSLPVNFLSLYFFLIKALNAQWWTESYCGLAAFIEILLLLTLGKKLAKN